MYTTEGGLQRAVIREVKRRYPDAWVFKVAGGGYQMAGVPDLLLVVDGMLIGMELKFQRPGESLGHARQRATMQQRFQIKAINQAGAIAAMVTTVEEALDLIARAELKRDRMEERDVREN